MSKEKKQLEEFVEAEKHRNLIAIAMQKRHSKNTKMRDKRARRSKDAKNSWQKDWE